MEFDPGLTHKLIDNPKIRDFVFQNKGVLELKMSAAYKTSSLNDIAERVKMGIKIIQAEIRTENPEIENLELDLFAWEFKRHNSNDESVLSHDLDLDEITYKDGYEFVFFPVKTRVAMERNPNPVKSITDTPFDCYCLLEEIGSTIQWVPCRILSKRRDFYIVELKTRIGFQIEQPREALLLSKAQMQHYEKDIFDH